MSKILLGERYRDTVFNIEGVLMALEEHMDVGLLGTLHVKDGKDPNAFQGYTISMKRLERIKGQPKPFKTVTAGKKHKIKFGELYRDGVMGAEGIAVARTEHLTGCERVKLQYMKPDTRELMQTEIDESVLLVVPKAKKAKAEKVVKKKSRPGPAPVQTSVAGQVW